MEYEAQAIHAVDQGLAECRDMKRYWHSVIEREPARRQVYGATFLFNAGALLYGIFAGNPWWLHAISVAGGGLMLKFYLDSPKRTMDAEHQIRQVKEIERRWLGLLYAVREGRPYEGEEYGP